MGSSKKHKEKDRKKKRRHRSRSRSRERGDRKDRDSDRKRSRLERDEQEDHRGSEVHRHERDDDSRRPANVARVAVKEEPTEDAVSGGGDLSLSVAETNKLRAKLGLKPLEEGGEKKDGGGEDQDVHVPAVNIGQLKETEKIREKMAAMRQKRLINKKLGKVKTLGDSDDDSALAWVMKSRRLQTEKEQALKREKLLQEMDDEFGVGNLVQEEFKPVKQEYASKDLRGLRVEHQQEAFREGKTVILTLADQDVLAEDGDTLVNVNMLDEERAARNVDNKKNKPAYKPYDEAAIDEYGTLQQHDVLEKYNEEIDGEKKESFQLGSGGSYNTEQDRRLQEIKTEMRQKGETLVLPPPVIAGEYYTESEMSFKKVTKKVRKLRKKPKMTKADDLIPLNSEQHLGNRKRHREAPIDEEIPRSLIEKSGPIPGLDTDTVNPEDDMDMGPDEDLTNEHVDEQNAAAELEAALSKARRLKTTRPPHNPQDVADRLGAGAGGEQSGSDDENIQLNTMEEFCRTLGEIPTYNSTQPEHDDDIMDFERELVEAHHEREAEQDDTGWHHVDIDTAPINITREEKGVLDDEPVINAGLAGALELANKKGYLETLVKKHANVSSSFPDLEAKNYSIEDKRLDDMDDKYSRKRDRYSGPSGGGMFSDFKEKDGYKPEVKLDYVDDNGRQMTPKEAFRFLSHKFHGKGSGKKKTEKRQKKVEEDLLMKTMSSTDTPLNTVQLLQQKQKAEKSAYVVLSGSSKGLSASSLSK